MNRFRTELPPIDFPFAITYDHRLLSLGSCFAEHIGRRLERFKFQSLLNPFGILYNPVSLAYALERLLDDQPFATADLFEHQGLWHSFAHHGSFSGPDQAATLRGINEHLERGVSFLQKADFLILTFGTAHVFTDRESGEVVANCHKLPGQRFERRRLGVREIVDHLEPVLEKLWSRRPEVRVITTVSPVRHIRDGLVENQRSKATLLLAVDELARASDRLHYFPSYELLLDDLRDYRFYAADMIHPGEQAVDYVWDYFERTCMDETTRRQMREIGKLVQAAEHRPLHPETDAHRQFVRRHLAKLNAFEQKFPFWNFEREKKLLSEQLR